MNRLIAVFLLITAGSAQAQDPFDPTGGSESAGNQASEQANAASQMVMRRLGELEARLGDMDSKAVQGMSDAAGQAGGVARKLMDSLPASAKGAAKLVGKINDSYWVDLNGIHLEVTESAFKQIQQSQLGSFGSGEE
jgi:uncharacterized alpha-E superfamily protein